MGSGGEEDRRARRRSDADATGGGGGTRRGASRVTRRGRRVRGGIVRRLGGLVVVAVVFFLRPAGFPRRVRVPPRRGRRPVGVRVRARVRPRARSTRRRFQPARRRASRRQRFIAPSRAARGDGASDDDDDVSSSPSLRPRRARRGDAVIVPRRPRVRADPRRVRVVARVRGIHPGRVGRVDVRSDDARGRRPGISRSDDVSQTFVRRHGGDRRRFSGGVRACRFGFGSRALRGDVRIGRFVSGVGGGFTSPSERDDVDAIDGRFGFPGDHLGSVELRRRRAAPRVGSLDVRGGVRVHRLRHRLANASRTRRRGGSRRSKKIIRLSPRASPHGTGVPARSRVAPATEHVPRAAERRRARRRHLARRRADRDSHGRGVRRAAGRDATAGDAHPLVSRHNRRARGSRRRVSTRRRRRRARDAAVIRHGVAGHARARGGSRGSSFGVADVPATFGRRSDAGDAVGDAQVRRVRGGGRVVRGRRGLGGGGRVGASDRSRLRRSRDEEKRAVGGIPPARVRSRLDVADVGHHEFAEYGSRRDAVLRRSGTVPVDGVSRIHRAHLGHARHERVHGVVRRRAVSHVVHAGGRDELSRRAKPRSRADHLLHPEHVRRVRRSTGGDARVQGVGRHAVLHPARRAGVSR